MKHLRLLLCLVTLVLFAWTGAGAQGPSVSYLSDRPWTSASNGWGPVERDRSNGNLAAGDGRPLTLNGVVYPKGLGVHAPSEIVYALDGTCQTLHARVGIDDEEQAGRVIFRVWAGDDLRYDSGEVIGSDAPLVVNLSVRGVRELYLEVDVAGAGTDAAYYDHADWADAYLTGCATAVVPTATRTPVPATVTRTPTRTPVPTVSNSGGPSGQAMPVGDLPGWRQVFRDDFTVDSPVGSWGSGATAPSAYAGRWNNYADGWNDTSAKIEGSPSRYMPSRVLSTSGGMLIKHLRTENGRPIVAAPQPAINGNPITQLYGKYTARMRADSLAGFKTAWLLWPVSEVWPRDGEIDFPEGGLNSHICAFMHRQGGTSGSDQDAFCTNYGYQSWHTYDLEWTPSYVSFKVDGQEIGRSTSRIPNTPMRWVLQTETCFSGCQPAATTQGKLEIDWVVQYARN